MHGLGFVPGSHLLVVTGNRSGREPRGWYGFVALADADRGRVLELTGQAGMVLPPAMSADGRLLVTASDNERTVHLWSLPDLRPVGGPLLFGRWVADVQVSPDGRRLTVVLVDDNHQNGTLEVWDAGGRRRVTRLPVPDTPTAVRFSPDGRLLAAGYQHGRSHLWSTASWKPVTRMLVGVGNIHALAISPDGRTLATGSENRTVRLWDIETQQAIGAPLPGPGRGAGTVAPYFTPDGEALIASYDTGRAYRWDIRPDTLKRHSCAVAGRRLTRSEWEEILPDRDYRPAC